jgi:hypothetical protein
MSDLGSEDKPVYVSFLPAKFSPKAFAGSLVMAIVPVAVVILMQRPALRQALVMRGSRAAANTCFELGEFFHGLGLRASTVYQKARL